MSELRVGVPGELVEAIAERVSVCVLAEPGGRPDGGEAWRLLDLEEAAGRLGRSTRWVRERVKRGELATIRLDGGALAFDVEDLRAFAAARRVGPGQPSVLAARLQDGGDPARGAGLSDGPRPVGLRVEAGDG